MTAPVPLERTRSAMAAVGVDAVLVASPGMVAFLTGHVAPAHIALPSRDSRLEKPTLALVTADVAVTIGTEPDPATGIALAYGEDAVGLHDAPTAFVALTRAMTEIGLTAGQLAVEATYVPAAVSMLVGEVHGGVRWRPLDDLLCEAKAMKDGHELAGIRAACDLCDGAQDAVRQAVRPGASEAELYAAAVGGACDRAGEHVIVGCELISGRRTQAGMGRAGSRRLEPGDAVMSDVFPRHGNGFWADSCMSVVCGEPTARDRKDGQRLRDAIEAGRERLRPGVTAGEVYDAVAAISGPLPVHAGHGIGRDHYEEPMLVPGNNTRLPASAAVVLEPGIYRDGRGLRLEWAFEVTPDGGVPLTHFSLDIEQEWG